MTATDTYLLLRAFCDELARCGMRQASTTPGSRSTPIVLSLVRELRIDCFSHLDERCGAVFALGAAKASGRPVAVTSTSGTAAANLAPAVIEAFQARVPLLVLTADRPPELRDLGAGQTIDQVKLYGRNAKWFLEVDDAPATPERMRWMRQLACRAVATATGGRPGPVHLNFSLREPLVLDEPLPAAEPGGGGRASGRPWVEVPAPAAPERPPAELQEALAAASRPLIVAGRLERPGDGAAVEAFAAACGIPLLADPLSGARGAAAIAHYDAYLRDSEWAAAHRPDLVIRAGDLPTAKPLRQWLAGLPDARQIALDPEAAWQDPSAGAELMLPPGPQALAGLEARAPAGWLEAWRRADAAAIEAFGRVLAGGPLSEPLAASRTAAALGSRDTLFVAASMPVRDLETFMLARRDNPRVLANRGANGIDGTISTALGIAAAAAPEGGGRTVALTGDVALLHDLGGLLAAGRTGTDLTVVVLDNDGGGIFHFLPVAGERDHFTEHVATPHGVDLQKVAALFGFDHVPAETPAQLDRALQAGGRALVHVRTDRDENVALHRRVWAEVARALRSGA
jgi:2-succinyl-5-enolpyruvyl-6-hydroxy-3-cyclohexene-1-carboxylate synthase